MEGREKGPVKVRVEQIQEETDNQHAGDQEAGNPELGQQKERGV